MEMISSCATRSVRPAGRNFSTQGAPDSWSGCAPGCTAEPLPVGAGALPLLCGCGCWVGGVAILVCVACSLAGRSIDRSVGPVDPSTYPPASGASISIGVAMESCCALCWLGVGCRAWR